MATKIRIRYNQVPYLTQDTTWEMTKTQLNITNESLDDATIHPDANNQMGDLVKIADNASKFNLM